MKERTSERGREKKGPVLGVGEYHDRLARVSSKKLEWVVFVDSAYNCLSTPFSVSLPAPRSIMLTSPRV